jgi:hypothetical protein
MTEEEKKVVQSPEVTPDNQVPVETTPVQVETLATEPVEQPVEASNESTQVVKEAYQAIKESSVVINEATTNDSKVASDTAPRVQVETNIHSLLFSSYPVVNLAFNNTIQVMTSPNLDASYIVPKTTVPDGNVVPGADPIETNYKTIKRTMKYGKNWRYDSILKEDLIERYYQVKNNGLSVNTVNGVDSANPVAMLASNLSHESLRDLENKFKNGIKDVNGFGIRGIYTQIAGMTSSSGLTAGVTNNLVASANSNFNYSLALFSNDSAGETAIVKDIMTRIRLQKFMYGVNSHVIFVGLGNGDYLRQIILKYKNTTEQQVVNQVKLDGSDLLLDNLQEDGSIRVDRNLRIIEDETLAAETMWMYPDVVRGVRTIQPYEYRADNKEGFRVIVDFGSGQVRDLLNTGVGDFEDIIFKGITGTEKAHVSLQWTGQIVAGAAMYGVKYTQAKMLTSYYADSIAKFNTVTNTTFDPIVL